MAISTCTLLITFKLCIIHVGASDLHVLTPFMTFLPRTKELQPVTFTLLLDSVAQEVNETFTLRLSYDQSLIGLPTDTVVNELDITIIDGDSTWAVLGGFLGFLETPWGSPRFFPNFYSLQNDCGHILYPMWLSASLPMAAAGLQIQSRPSSPQFQCSRQMQNPGP